MKGIILYKSKYGATKKYVDWLSESTGFTCLETDKADIGMVSGYDVIVLGGGIYASGVAVLSFFKKNIVKLKDKKLIVFCCGASPFDKDAFEEIVRRNMKDELEGIPCFYCRGAWDEDRMSFRDRTLCRLLQKAVAKMNQEECEPWQKALMCAVGQKCDWTDKAYLEPLIKYIKDEDGFSQQEAG